MFERFDNASIKTIMQAMQQAKLLKEQIIGTEHTLLALSLSTAPEIQERLEPCGISYAKVLKTIADLPKSQAMTSSSLEPTFSPNMKTLFETAGLRAVMQKRNTVTPLDFLLSFSSENLKNSNAWSILRKLGYSETDALSVSSLDINTEEKELVEIRTSNAWLSDLKEKYDIEAKLADGGMGSIFLANHKGLGKRVIVKVLHPHYQYEKDYRQRFMREAECIAKLSHPNIADIYDYGSLVDHRLYIVMEFVDGTSFKDVLKERKRLSLDSFINLFEQVADALDFSHSKDVIHRDIKPANIMISNLLPETKNAKLIDFGIAKTLNSDEQNITQTGQLIGTPLYMSPEQCLGKKVDKQSDIYSLGCVMFESLQGNAPYSAESTIELLMKHVSEKPPEFTSELDIPEPLKNLIFRCLEKDPEKRIQSMSEVKDHLSSFAMKVKF